MHKILGETIDMLCFTVLMTGTLFLFSYFWKDNVQLDYAEHLVSVFFDEAERKQVITDEEYIGLCELLVEINDDFCIEIEIRRKNEIIYREGLQDILSVEKKFDLKNGDFLCICLCKGKKKRSVQFVTIRS